MIVAALSLAAFGSPHVPVPVQLCSRPVGLLFVLLCIGSVVPEPTRAQVPVSDSSVVYGREAQRFFVRGLTQSWLDNQGEALSSYQNALDLASNRPAILMALADAHAARDEYTSALFYAREARLASDRPRYALRLGGLYQQIGQYENARSTYRSALESNPSDPGTRRALAQLQLDRNRPERALNHYEHLTDARPGVETDVYSTILGLYRQIGDSTGVAETLQSLVSRRPNVDQYVHQLARVHAHLGHHEDAIRLYESLLVSAPADTAVRRPLIRLYRETGQARRADSLAHSAP